jgi:hypothetical protein
MKDAAGDFGSFFNIGMGFYVAAAATVILLIVGLRGVMASRS